LDGRGRGRRSNRRKEVYYLISEKEVGEGTEEGRLNRLLHEIIPAWKRCCTNMTWLLVGRITVRKKREFEIIKNHFTV
jgi:hypothetical protein